MKVRIIEANHARGLYIFIQPDGEHGYFELLGEPDLDVGDILIGDFSGLGGVNVRHMGTGETVDIFIEDFCSLQLAREMIHR